MEAVTPMAEALSTYGLYAIVAVLAVVVVFLYKRVADLEKELRTTIQANANESSKQLTQNASETAKLLAQTTEVLKDNTRAFIEFQSTLAELKTTLQVAMEKMKS